MRAREHKLILGILLMFFALFLTASSKFVADAPKTVDGKATFERKCLKCHKIDKFKKIHNDRMEWEMVLRRMERNSCILTDAEANAVATYLTKEYGK